MNISCDGISIAHKDTPFVSNIHLTLKQGEVTLLYGGSGTGKTSLFNTLCGLVPPSSPEATLHWDDYRVSRLNHAHKVRHKYLSLLGSEFVFLKSLTAWDNLIFPAVAAGKSHGDITRRVDELCDVFANISEKLDLASLLFSGTGPRRTHAPTPVYSRSNGQKELLGLARALMNRSPFLFADELFRSVNDNDTQTIWNRLMDHEIGPGKAGLFLITHKSQIGELAGVDQIYTISNQRLTLERNVRHAS